MATFTAVKNRGGGRGALGGVLRYTQQDGKTLWEGQRLVTGWNCTAQSALSEMLLTKERFRKTDGRQDYHFVQSFAETDDLTPQEAHAIALDEFKQYMGIESPSLLAQASKETQGAPAPAPAETVQEPQEAPETPAPKKNTKKAEKAAPAEAEPAPEPADDAAPAEDAAAEEAPAAVTEDVIINKYDAVCEE